MANEFIIDSLNEVGLKRVYGVVDAFNVLLGVVNDLVPTGRERALVVTKLQEAAFFAKHGIALDKSNQK